MFECVSVEDKETKEDECVPREASAEEVGFSPEDRREAEDPKKEVHHLVL